MGTYSRPGDYERAHNRDIQAGPHYRESGNHLDYFPRPPEAVHTNSSSRPADALLPETQYFPAIVGGIGPLTDRLGALELTEQEDLGRPPSPTNNLRHAMKAVEAAESAIMVQMQENEYLRNELQLTTWELQNYKLEGTPAPQKPEENSGQASQKLTLSPPSEKLGFGDVGGAPVIDRERLTSNGSQGDLQGTLVVHQSLSADYNNHVLLSPAGLPTSKHHSSSNMLNVSSRGLNQGLSSGQPAADCSSFSQISSPSSRSVSPNRHHREGDFDSRAPLSSQGLMQTPEISNQSSLWKQDLLVRARAQEEEILQLRRRLADDAIKELKLRNEKHVLEKRIAGMRMAFDQQQQDLVDAATKALSYRHDIMEENIRLTYSLQAAEQERSIFVSSLLPLLAEYDFQPPVPDAHLIVSNVKVLIQHLHEKLNLSEAKLKDLQYHSTAWRTDPVYQSPYAPLSPFHPNNDHSHPSLSKNGLEIVPRPSYSQGQTPSSPPSRNHNTGADWEPIGVKYQPVGMSSDVYHGVSHDPSRQSPHDANENFELQVPANLPRAAQTELRTMLPSNEESTVHAPMNDPYSDSEIEETTGSGSLRDKEQLGRDVAGRSPHLPTLPEEPNSSASEDDDPLPAIDHLQIVNDAVPGSTLQACGISINGTALCVFQWVRHIQDGTMCYIEGAAQPEYTVTADDVDALLAIECVPMDSRNRKGELVKVFANNQNKITCEDAMQERIKSYFFAGQAVFEVLLSTGSLDIWEPVTLTLKRSIYEIKSNKLRRVVVSEKYSAELTIVIPFGHPTQCVLTSSYGNVYALSTHEDNPLRDTIVLTMRLFQKQALEKRKGKRKVPFFNKIVSG